MTKATKEFNLLSLIISINLIFLGLFFIVSDGRVTIFLIKHHTGFSFKKACIFLPTYTAFTVLQTDKLLFHLSSASGTYFVTVTHNNYLASLLTFLTVLVLGRESSSLALTSTCFSIACNLSSGRLIDGCLWNLKPNSFRSCAACFLPSTSLQILSKETP